MDTQSGRIHETPKASLAPLDLGVRIKPPLYSSSPTLYKAGSALENSLTQNHRYVAVAVPAVVEHCSHALLTLALKSISTMTRPPARRTGVGRGP